MAEIYVDFLCLILFIVTTQCRAGSPVTETVSTSLEEDVTLSCSSSNQTEPNSGYRIKWVRYDADTNQRRDIFVWPKKIQDGAHLKGTADGDERGQLFLKKVKKSDEGLYGCEIWRGWDIFLAKNISLKVKDCKVLQTVKAVPGTDLKLDLPGNITSLHNISWAMLKGNKPVPVNSKRTEINGTSLVIKSVIYTDSGWYRCTYMTGQTQRCFDINVLVQEQGFATATTTVPDKPRTTYQASGTKFINWTEANSGTLISVVTSVGVGILLIWALVVLLIYRRRRPRRGAQQQIQMRPAVTQDSMEGYEPVDLPHLQGPSNTDVNGFYQDEDENICTFH